MVRITGVARRAGVSPSTVSYALSGKRPISAATRRRVEAAVRELGYRPPGRARPAAGGRTNVLALVLPPAADVTAPVVTERVASLITTARAHGRDVLLATRAEGPDGLRSAADAAPADALIVTDVRAHDPRLPLLRALGRPCVLIGLPAEPDGLTCVDVDAEAAGALCVDHLAGLGHRAVALVGPPPRGPDRRVVRGFTAAAARGAGLRHVRVRDGPGRRPADRGAAAARAARADRRRGPRRAAAGTARRRLRGAGCARARRRVRGRPGPGPAHRAGRPSPGHLGHRPGRRPGRAGGGTADAEAAGEPVPAATLLPPRLTRGASTAPPGA
ncbi:hypothetical protein SUDANB6_03692 [Streptomyces sp. enrichment culture]